MTYEVAYTQRGINGALHYKTDANSLEEVLMKLFDKCSEEDDTGIFFELENADLDWVQNNKKVKQITTPYGKFAIELKEIKISDPSLDQQTLDIRAKKELLGDED